MCGRGIGTKFPILLANRPNCVLLVSVLSAAELSLCAAYLSRRGERSPSGLPGTDENNVSLPFGNLNAVRSVDTFPVEVGQRLVCRT
jgi:hypothetical protein